jgi:hypothetical protein
MPPISKRIHEAALAEIRQRRKTTGFRFPKGCHGGDVRLVTTNVGQTLQKAMPGIEIANPGRGTVSSAMQPGPIRTVCRI